MDNSLKNHNIAVGGISDVITKARQSSKKLKIYHGGSNSTRKQDFRKDSIVDTSNLNDVLSFDLAKKTVSVEPNVSMKTLFEHTSKFGLMSRVVMEFPEITVGGGIAGVSGESSSFKYGGFHEGAIEYEVVLGDGKVVVASKNTNSDLFYALPGSYGTLLV